VRRSVRWVFNQLIAYRDKKVVGVFVRFRAPATTGEFPKGVSLQGAVVVVRYGIPASTRSTCTAAAARCKMMGPLGQRQGTTQTGDSSDGTVWLPLLCGCCTLHADRLHVDEHDLTPGSFF
jgi:hypothetical protein